MTLRTTFRSQLLAGLIVASGTPALAFARTPYVSIGEGQQLAETGRGYTGQLVRGGASGVDAETAVQFSLRHKEAMDRGESHLDASRHASQGSVSSAASGRDWSRRHKLAMDRGASHLDASMQAGRL